MRSLAAVCCAVVVAVTLVTTSARQNAPRPPGKILYIEGEPRFEMKFIKSALADNGPAVVFLQRTADGKYLRINVDGPEDLRDGFPRTQADLFRFSAIILGSIEASAFDAEQHRLLAAFVTDHGGGLLALGGTHALGAGGWDGTPISALLPIEVEPAIPSKSAIPVVARLKVEPTTAGLEHPATQPLGRPADSPVWRVLPPLSSVNAVYTLKPGATALLTALDATGREAVVLAVGREGRGRTAAFTVQDSWQWQMQSKTPVSVHAEFWQALLGWLVEGAPKFR